MDIDDLEQMNKATVCNKVEFRVECQSCGYTFGKGNPLWRDKIPAMACNTSVGSVRAHVMYSLELREQREMDNAKWRVRMDY
jgi:hypothetical protein